MRTLPNKGLTTCLEQAFVVHFDVFTESLCSLFGYNYIVFYHFEGRASTNQSGY